VVFFLALVATKKARKRRRMNWRCRSTTTMFRVFTLETATADKRSFVRHGNNFYLMSPEYAGCERLFVHPRVHGDNIPPCRNLGFILSVL
jgi:hypothetical protein